MTLQEHLLDELLTDARIRASLPPPAICREIRERAGLTQADVARVLGVTKQMVTRWESGEQGQRRRLQREYARLIGRLEKEVSTTGADG